MNRDVGSTVVFESNKKEGIAVVVEDPMLIPKFVPERYDTFTAAVEDMLLLTSSSDENVDVDMDLAAKVVVESSSSSSGMSTEEEEEEEGSDEDEDMIVLVSGCVSDAVNVWFDCALEEDVTVPP